MNAYADAGVNIEKGNEIAKYLGFKDFGASLMIGGEEVVISTDGVGTKILVAEAQNKFDTIGIDLVAMCVNDILCKFAQPIGFLDYYATGEICLDKSKEILKGILKGCELAGCTLMGGETAEMPGVYEGSKFDLAGFVVGTVIDRHVPRIVQEGDILVGIHSSGPHSNGFSMLREVLPIDEIPLTPTRIYTDEILNNHHLINAVSHITGGGLIENIPRMLGGREHSLEVSIVGDLVYGNDWWNDLYLKCQNKMDMREFLTIFNGGYGMVLAVSPHNVDKLNIENVKVIGKVL
jgi:phosphoribosylformylglycinamidine cyclo-ligase|tara:strand:+ start:4426 stop:5301 length:876 start_codon:yes stop_codon:yes gene_type:complete